MWLLRVVVTPPLFNDDLSFFQAVKYLPVKELIAELPLRFLS